MDGQGVAGEEQLHEPALDQILQMLARAGVNNGGAAYHENFAAVLACEAHFARERPNDSGFRLFRGDVAGHELKLAQALRAAHGGTYTNAAMPGRDEHALAHVVKFYGRS